MHLLLPFLFLLGSCTTNSSMLSSDRIPAKGSSASYFYTPPPKSPRDIQFLVFNLNGEERGLLYLFGPPLHANHENKTIQFTITINQESTSGTATILEGGQKLLLEPSTTLQLISALKDHKAVSFSIGRYTFIPK